MQKRIPHILHLVLSLDVGGAEQIINHLISKQPQRQLQQTVCCLDRIGTIGIRLQRKGYCIESLKRRPGFDWTLVLRLWKFYRKKKIDLVHTHGESPWFYGALAANLIPWLRIPCITTIHGYGGGDRYGLKNYRLWKFLASLSQKVVFVSKIFEQELISVGIAPNKTITIVNGVEKFSSKQKAKDKILKQRYAIYQDNFVIGIVARLSHIKNHVLLLKAICRLIRLGKSGVRLLVVGDGPERENLERLARELSIRDAVVFCGEQNNVASYYSLFDLFILPSFSEGISMTILEAMSAGVPVIASAVGGNVEVIRHGHNGLLFPTNDLEALVRAISSLIEDPALATKLAQEGRRTVQDIFSMETMLTAYRNLYHELLG